ncbi:di-trans,poly-cis-decaprenylcistransferase [Candidatus Amesbacteria bacterium RIFCSPLOWO2_02_FULL_48_11]|uniref:Isoprenyl transferase n=5 Tax=Candidatus Amesiibacteriota TaxID=1752730 RepID=A0A1F4Z9G3_9BACT|nr:MAG: Isoprenyl transferase [Candidatus Amesbacteria bacterium GW2011_GWA2_47_11]KKU91931.1 MAG: Isoprenyl transferase [Candidatus Amesbacteria bacterium GW2011_GWC1_48_10]KKU99181.1 MAG: Isoprenyl transferase [Candidatus Amesbacteria bacterium GW2011_GWA1_48_9]OGC90075.1 MAG: di-trans,poly-cis-decaprenylcistransferase [Candidatus Amesbacteria bacterium RBG_19FT_COMBO_48_16]OGC96738.1 MAG: di-trans,poly-cis-decaprenylcistransferase [Candidatus Amesbacteria bacterium RIFCSPHIGHO2_02_FULL_48_21
MEALVPTHVALIMDGNRRWAKKRNLPPIEGHKMGEKRIEPVALRCKELGVLAVSFYTLSRENLNRPRGEVEALLDVLRVGAGPMLKRLAEEDIRFVPLGNLLLFPQDICDILLDAAGITCHNEGMIVNLALAYDGRDEIVRAVGKLNAGGITGDAITEELISSKLDTAGQPDPDLVIRTGGRSRLSGYLPWQTVYSEIYFTSVLWPDFMVEDFDQALKWYREQVRTFGK